MFLRIFTVSLFFLFCQSSVLYAQLENSKALLRDNKIFSQEEKICNSSCTTFYTEYDRRGNMILYNFYRLGSYTVYSYDKEDNMAFYYWVDKIDSTDMDTIYPKDMYPLRGFDTACEEDTLDEGRLIIKTLDDQKREIHLDEEGRVIKELRYENGILESRISWTYDAASRLLEQRTIDKESLENKNSFRQRIGREPLDAIVERFSYNDQSQVTELYTYFVDPCIGLDNHYLYKYVYLDNGLLSGAEVFEGDALAFSIEFSYEYYLD